MQLCEIVSREVACWWPPLGQRSVCRNLGCNLLAFAEARRMSPEHQMCTNCFRRPALATARLPRSRGGGPGTPFPARSSLRPSLSRCRIRCGGSVHVHRSEHRFPIPKSLVTELCAPCGRPKSPKQRSPLGVRDARRAARSLRRQVRVPANTSSSPRAHNFTRDPVDAAYRRPVS